MKVALAVWLGALLLIFVIAAWLLSHDPWIMYWSA